MKRILSFFAIALLIVLTCAWSNAQEKTPALLTSKERIDILNTLRARVEKQLGQKVKFVVQIVQRGGDWVLIQVKPVQLNGTNINYKTTAYYKGNREQIDDGFFDDHVLALLKNENGTWRIMEYEIGATDYSGDYWKEKHGIMKLFKTD